MASQIKKLSKHFSLAELTTTQVLDEKTGKVMQNTPHSPIVISNLRVLCEYVLEKVREQYGRPIIVHSGYRSPAVNKAVGGQARSQHMKGMAADFHVQGVTNYEVALWIESALDYDQLILENFVPSIRTSGWIHCSISRDPRYDVLTKFKGSSKTYDGILLTPPSAGSKQL